MASTPACRRSAASPAARTSSSRPPCTCWNASSTAKPTCCGSSPTPPSRPPATRPNATCAPRKPSRRSAAGSAPRPPPGTATPSAATHPPPASTELTCSPPSRTLSPETPGYRPSPPAPELHPEPITHSYTCVTGTPECLPGLRPNPTSLVPSQLDSIFNIPAGKDNLPSPGSSHPYRQCPVTHRQCAKVAGYWLVSRPQAACALAKVRSRLPRSFIRAILPQRERYPQASCSLQGALVILILGCGYDKDPTVGPGSRGFHKPQEVMSFRSRRDRAGVCAGQGSLARAQIRSRARAISAAHGQEAWIFSCRRRAPRTSRPAACRIR